MVRLKVVGESSGRVDIVVKEKKTSNVIFRASACEVCWSVCMEGWYLEGTFDEV